MIRSDLFFWYIIMIVISMIGFLFFLIDSGNVNHTKLCVCVCVCVYVCTCVCFDWMNSVFF